MSIPRKHHYLPQFYLEGFKIKPMKGKKAHIWQIEKKDSKKFYSPAIENTGCIRDFHSIDFNEKDSDHKSIESILSRIESEQAALTGSIIESGKIDISKIEEISTYMSLMRYRVPSFANHIEASLKSVVLDSFKLMYQNGQFGQPPSSLKTEFESKGIDEALKIDISNWKILSHMFGVGLSAESIGLLTKYNYHIYTVPKGNGFVTSDNPVALYHPEYKKIQPYGVGLAIKGTEITFPLTSEILLLGGSHVEPGCSIARHEEVLEFNRRTIVMAEQYIFSAEVTDALRNMVETFKSTRAGFVFDNIFHGDGSVHISRFIPVQ